MIITEKAHEYLATLLEKQNMADIGIRIFVTDPGTVQAETCIAYCKPNEVVSTDISLALEKFTVWIDYDSEPYLESATIDYSLDRMGGQLTIKAPNARSRAIDPNSSIEEKVKYYLEVEINPGLLSHGGKVSFVKLTEENIAVIILSGGCQGCGQAHVTLKDGIERTLLKRIPELKGVRDTTDHSQKENAYY